MSTHEDDPIGRQALLRCSYCGMTEAECLEFTNGHCCAVHDHVEHISAPEGVASRPDPPPIAQVSVADPKPYPAHLARSAATALSLALVGAVLVGACLALWLTADNRWLVPGLAVALATAACENRGFRALRRLEQCT